MVSYVINFILWVLNSMATSVIMCYAFELKKETGKVRNVILALFFSQVPLIVVKFIFNQNDLIRNLTFLIMTALYVG